VTVPQQPVAAPRVIALWSAPRARSTAFFRSMVERGDLETLHEPFCNLVDFGEMIVGGEMVRSGQELISAIRELSARRRVFFKDTTDYRYPAVLDDERFVRDAVHTFLIRHPAEVAASYYALKPDMTAGDLGFEHMHEMYRRVRDLGGLPVILDSDDLVRRPAEAMAAYCAAVGLPSSPRSLSWRPGSRAEWSRSDRWHSAVSASSGFTATSTEYRVTVHNSAVLAGFCARNEPFYRALREERLVIG
jgi:Sulfotransferase domain